MKRYSILCVWLLCAIGGCGGDDAGSSPRTATAQTDSGPVEGFENEGVFSYRGIPYAAPPVGELRWKPPADPAPWTDTRVAVDSPSPCPQEPFAGLPVPGFAPSEDCLYLNVDTPVEGSDLPVMVWIHGGGFTLGEGLQTDGGTSGDRMARKSGVVVVSMNYRLGQLGFLAHAALSDESADGASGNYGLMDQTAALRWVQRNIEAFGGDPSNVTIFGESAGAFSVCSHLASPQSSGLFHKAISMSGSCERPWPTLAAAEAQGDEFAVAVGCGSEGDVLSCMRGKSIDDVLAALPPAPNFGFNPTDAPTGSWGPIFDGAFFPEQPAEAFASGNFNQVPTMVGFTRDEARLFTWLGELADPPLEVTADDYEDLIARLVGGDAELAARAASQYPLSDYSEPAVALAAVATDTVFRCPGKTEAAKLSGFGPVYLYQFEYPNGHSQLEVALPFIGGSLPSYDLGAFHGSDIPYVFGYDPVLEIDFETFSTVLNPWPPGTADEALWLRILGYFSTFARTGEPGDVAGTEWPTYDASTGRYVVLDTDVSIGTNVASECDFWDTEDYLAPELVAP
ncbi:MAG: carboxylesterase/lipase family protein [Myxococcales bacterium]|jgi:para-nitrobenzyl esterase